jgi:hypothetical protein
MLHEFCAMNDISALSAFPDESEYVPTPQLENTRAAIAKIVYFFMTLLELNIILR